MRGLSPHSEVLVIVTVLTALIAAEIVLRANQSALSGDIAHLERTTLITFQVSEGSGLRVLFWGNSLLGEGVDVDGLVPGLEAALDTPLSVGLVRPDGTTPLEWQYLFRKAVLNTGTPPDVLVLAFGPGHLKDRPAAPLLSRLAVHHVDLPDIPLLFEQDVHTLEARARFLTARVSAVFALAERIQPRIMDVAVPRYTDLAPILLLRQNSDDVETVEGDPAAETSYHQLRSLLSAAKEAGVVVVALPMPAPELWPLDQEEVAVLSEYGAVLLDVRGDVELKAERFPDGVHLDREGRVAFTDAVAARLPDVIEFALGARDAAR